MAAENIKGEQIQNNHKRTEEWVGRTKSEWEQLGEREQKQTGEQQNREWGRAQIFLLLGRLPWKLGKK